MMRLSYINLLLCYTVSGAFKLTPSEVAHVCPGQQLVLTCETMANYLRWNITFSDSGYTDERLVTSYGIQDVVPLRINNIVFNFTRISEVPLVATMSILNVTTNLRIGCREYTELSTKMLSTLVLLVRAEDKNDYRAPEIGIAEEFFNSTGVTVILDLISALSDVHPYSVSVTVVPSDQPVTMITNNTHAELTLPYNVRYNVSFICTFCGLNDESSTIQLFYVTCGDIIQSTSLRHDFIGYHDPAVEGTSIHFTCPLGKILIGPNISTCMQNGEWEPDPREVECIGTLANCEPPYNNHTTMTYNSTLEGSVLTFRCQPELIPNDTYMAVCHRNASWVPDPAQLSCITHDHNDKTSGIPSMMLSHAALVAITSTLCISSCAVLCVLFLTVGLVCMKLKSSNGVRRATAGAVRNFEMTGEPSPAHVYEAIVPKTLINQEEESMDKNIAYGQVYTVCK